jgi:exodeoxyribonuclease V alpha subunit
MTTPDCLLPYLATGVIADTDAAAAALLVDVARRDAAARGARCDPSSVAWLGMCLALRTPRDGHTCVDLDRGREWAGEIDFGSADRPAWPATAAEWIAALTAATPLVGTPGDRTPFILDGSRLYLARSLAAEEGIAAVIRGETGVDVRILLGGPGTGKTTTVAADLVQRFAEARPHPRLALAAPTAKAAARMTAVLRARCADDRALAELGVVAAPEVRAAVLAAVDAAPATTVHKLLGANPRGRRLFAFDAGHPLPYDLVVVDECSMLSSSLMHRLLMAADRGTELHLVGDPDQLVSVEAGSVLADIREIAAAEDWETAGRSRTLTEQRRFREAPEIGALAAAVRAGRATDALGVLRSATTHVRWVRGGRPKDVDAVVELVVAEARDLCTAAARRADDVLARKERMQVLCATREGPLGVAGWNRRIEGRLGDLARGSWYAGRPVMVTRNSRALGLANGDVGVIVPAAGNRMEGVFDSDARPVRVPVARLENVATVHALTIHKSQGSEYDHVVVVLPDRASRLLTRELLYTAVTRGRTQLTLIGSEDVITAAIERPIRRATGLAGRLRV